MALFDELKRRNVIRVALAYAVLSWLLLQVGDTLFITADGRPASEVIQPAPRKPASLVQVAVEQKPAAAPPAPPSAQRPISTMQSV